MGSPKKFKTAVLGGTFDHFHKGHKNFLEHGLSISKRLVVGVTSDEYVQKLKIQSSKFIPIQSGQNLKSFEKFSFRENSVEEFLKENAPGRFEIIEIDDMFGTTLDKNFPADAIVVSKETLKGAKIINTVRKEKNLPPLKIIIQSSVLAKDGKPISSFRIRKGEIDREGKLYIDPDWLSNILYLPPQLRTELKDPLGKLFEKMKTSDFKNNFFITVGDEATKTFNSLGFAPDISVVDFRVARKNVYTSLRELGFLGKSEFFKIQNPPGTLTPELFSIFKNSFKNNKKPRTIFIEGEEDLSVLPAVLAAPLGWTVYYGQPGTGIVKILVDEKNKAKIHKIVASFITRGY